MTPPTPSPTATMFHAYSENYPSKKKNKKKNQTQACKLKHKYNISICKVTDKKKCYKLFVCIESRSCSGSYTRVGEFAALVAYNLRELRKA